MILLQIFTVPSVSDFVIETVSMKVNNSQGFYIALDRKCILEHLK